MSRPMTPVASRVWRRVAWQGDNCWIWTGALNASGYGVVGEGDKRLHRVHRWVYEQLVGPIPDGLQLDHLCRVRACCNPLHLEPVTNRENWLRGNHPTAVTVRTEVCSQGHPFSGENLYTAPNGARKCRACIRIRQAVSA